MEKSFRIASGISLLVGSVLSILTMSIHPSGGNLEQIIAIKRILIFSHSIATFCVPVIAFGLLGLSKFLSASSNLSVLAFSIAAFGLFGVMQAGIINGLVLPEFASKYIDGSTDRLLIEAIIDYGATFNKSLTYVFMAAITTAISIWSVIMVTTGALSKLLGYYGLLIVSLGVTSLLLRFNFLTVAGFGAFIFGLASWLIVASILLLISSLKPLSHEGK